MRTMVSILAASAVAFAVLLAGVNRTVDAVVDCPGCHDACDEVCETAGYRCLTVTCTENCECTIWCRPGLYYFPCYDQS